MCVALHALVIVGVTGPVALQALVIVGVTGPVVFFTQTVHMMADTIDAPFLQFMGWICVWSGLMHVIVAGALVSPLLLPSFCWCLFAAPLCH